MTNPVVLPYRQLGEQDGGRQPPTAGPRRQWRFWITGALAMLIIVAIGACTLSPRVPATVPVGVSVAPDVAATIAVAVQATVQARATSALSSPLPSVAIDESFASTPQGWPNQPGSTAWYADGMYHLQPREAGQFVAIDAPPTDAFHDGTVSARFHKDGGPPGGGYGLIVADQGPEVHDGLDQGGQFVVLEVGDDGTIGAWQRAGNRWIDIVPWAPNTAVNQDSAANSLSVRTTGHQLTFLVNDTQVAQFATDLPAGRVGVFVGGDGNQVVLERFTAQWGSQSNTAATRPNATALPLAPAKTTATPTPAAADLLARLDTAWAQGRWSDVQSLLDQIEMVAPTALDFNDKRYAAHMAAGEKLLASGNSVGAADEFAKAMHTNPDRPEALVALTTLTPTAVPVPKAPTTESSQPAAIGVAPEGVVLPPDEAVINAVLATTTPWGGPVELGVVGAARSGVRVPIILDTNRYSYTYACATGRCKGFTADVWHALPSAEKRAYLDHLLDAIHAALPDRSISIVIEPAGSRGNAVAGADLSAGKRSYQGL